MIRSLERWAGMVPEAVVEGSKAQIVFALADAKKDIAELAAVLHDIVAADGMRPGHVAYLSRADIAAMARAAIAKAEGRS